MQQPDNVRINCFNYIADLFAKSQIFHVCLMCISIKILSYFSVNYVLRARLHQTSVLTLQQLCNDASNTALIENNGVTLKWVATLFWSDSIDSNDSSISRVITALTLTLGVNGTIGS